MPPKFSKEVPQDAGLGAAARGGSLTSPGGTPRLAFEVGGVADVATPAKRKRQTRKLKGSPGDGGPNGNGDEVAEEEESLRQPLLFQGKSFCL